MDPALVALGFVCLLVALVGCLVPMLPGPPIAYCGLLMLHLTEVVQFSTVQLLVWLALVVVVQLLDYFVPMWGSKWTGGSKWGSRGCLVGTLIGLFFMPWGILVGPFLGAMVGELLSGHTTSRAILSGIGSLLGFLFGTVLKCMLCGYFAWEFVRAAIS